MLGGCPVLEECPMFEGRPVFGRCPLFEGCPLFGGCPDSEISHGRSMYQGFRGCPKDLKCKKKHFCFENKLSYIAS